MGSDEAWSKAWWAEKLIIPILVGVSVFVVTFIVPKLFVRDKELSIHLLSKNKGSVHSESNSATTNNEKTKKVSHNSVKYSIKVLNSGALPLKNVPVRFLFENVDSNFKVIRIDHNTIPEYEFGSIKDETPDNDQIRFVYSLLNPDDEDLINIWLNRETDIKPYAKAEGMVLKLISSSKTFKSKPEDELKPPILIQNISSQQAFFLGVLGALLSELTIVFNFLVNRKKATRLPSWLKRPIYWIMTCIMALTGGGLVFAYDHSGIFMTSPLLALHLGASAPLIIQHMTSRLPGIEPGRIA